MMTLEQKEQELEKYIKQLGSVAVGFSSGVDSTYLLKKAKEILKDNVIAITVKLNSIPKRELDEAIEFCRKEKIKQIIIEYDELQIEGFADNPKNRCYICKKAIFSKIKEIAKENGIENVAEGSNIDDLGDYRPGLQAIKELDIKSPLKQAKLSKNEIRELSKKINLSTWDKPSFACLATRFVYGEKITKEKLEMIDKAEQLLLDMGLKQVRVRIHQNMARIEVNPDEIEIITKEKNRKTINKKFKEYGFSYVTLDLEGYRTGSMNIF